MSGLKQPVLGILATALIIAISLGFISLFDFPKFSGWVATFLLCIIPMEIVMGVTWGLKQPRFAAQRSQPVRGVLFSVIALVTGVIVAVAHWTGVGGSLSPPTPMLTQCLIASVVIMFWLAIMWGGWPFTALIKNPIAAGLAVLVACYVINYIFFRVFFNYDFMKGAPVYVAAQDPQGMFNAWSCVVFYVTAIGVMFLLLCFDLWPLTKSPSLMKQPVLGIVWTILALLIGGGAMYVGVNVMHMDVVAFMVTVPIPFIFGTIFVLNMLQGSLFAKLTQPLKGVLNTVAAVVLGSLFALMYRELTQVVTGKLDPGPPGYQSEIWLASALLSVTFPFLVAYADFFTMWPLQRANAERVMETAEAGADIFDCMRIGIFASGVLLAAAIAFAQAPPAPPAPGPSPAYARAATLPARIEKFTATPESIQPGQSVTLVWATENPVSVSIDPTVGKVRPRGNKTVSPSATTSYTLTVKGPKDQVVTQTVTVTVAGTVAANIAPAAAPTSVETPRMPDGKPNLTGVYNSAGGARDAVQPTLKPEAENFKVVRGPTDAGVYSTCMPTGVPLAYFVPYQWEIVQGLDRVVILYEYLHMFRVVPINGTHPADPDPTWMGDSVGHWEGDTLVVDSVGFNDHTELPGAFRHSEALHVVERFHRTDFDHLQWEATIEDPNVFAKPWTLTRTFPLRTDLEKVDEYVCENNKDYKDLFGK